MNANVDEAVESVCRRLCEVAKLSCGVEASKDNIAKAMKIHKIIEAKSESSTVILGLSLLCMSVNLATSRKKNDPRIIERLIKATHSATSIESALSIQAKKPDSSELLRLFKTEFAKKGAIALHSKPGGSREKKEKIRAIWGSGKYRSKDLCAEQECAALNMSFSAARRALRNIPSSIL